MDDIGKGCEAAVERLKGWTQALARRDFDYLDRVLAPDFQFTGPAAVGGGRMDKERFIEMDRHIYNADIRLVGLTARRHGDIVTMLSFADVNEEFRGDLGPGMPSAADMNARANDKTLAYGTAWRENGDGNWQCTSHHIFGEVA